MIGRGAGWGEPAAGPPDAETTGGDPALAAVVRAARAEGVVPRIRFAAEPRSDLARSVGLVGRGAATTEVALDVIDLGTDSTDGALAVNAVVLGPRPDRLRWWHRRRHLTVVVDGRTLFDGRASTVLVANGQFLRGYDAVPAGHPGDGRLEVQVYALDPGERAPMRRRLRSASHLPHPRISTGAGRAILVEASWPGDVEVDGDRLEPLRRVRATVVPEAYRLLV